jgi:cell division protein FtsW
MIPSYPTLRKTQRALTTLLAAGGLAVVLLFGVTNIGTEVLKQTPLYHIAVRIENAKNPYNDIYGTGYQPANSLYGIADSGFIGKGFGNSARKYGYLTQADNDYILAVTIEETGIIGFAIIIFLYGVIEARLFYYAIRTQDTSRKIILIGTGAYLFFHFVLNVGGVGALIPMTGIPLLFISSGGSSLLAISIALGLCQRQISIISAQERKGELQ